MISFRIPATCQCGVFASAGIDFCLYSVGGNVFVNHRGCGPRLASYDEYRYQSRTVVIAPAIPRQSDGAACPKGPRAPIRLGTRSRR